MNQFYNNVTQKGRHKKKILLDMYVIFRYVTHFMICHSFLVENI